MSNEARVKATTYSSIGHLARKPDAQLDKSYRRQGSDSPVVFFTLPFSFTLDFVFTLTFWLIHLTLTLFSVLTLTYLLFHYFQATT